jgi:UDP-GlcNAc:undecaprenyl-phosphate GlcNAc-1-phosphate transferase
MNAVAPSLWGIAAFVLTVGTVWLLNPIALRFALVDRPAGRKDHAEPTPVTGGIAMLLAVLVCGAFVFDGLGRGSMGFALAAVMLVVVGVLDDRYDLPWWSRMLVQVAAALVLVYVGDVRIERLGSMFGPQIDSMGVWSTPFTVFAVVGAINAVNMADGADGLAGSLVFACLVMLALVAFHAGNASVYQHMPILIGAVAGFLVFNFRWPGRKHAAVFMGNSGSALLGLVIACFIARLTQNVQHPVDPVLALWLLPVPLIDCLVLMLRRLRHGHSPFSPDHNHVHYLMREAGFGPTRSALVLVAFSVGCGLLALLALHVGIAPVEVFGAFVCLCLLWYWITSRRARAVGMFRVLRKLLGGRAPVAVPQPGQVGSK